tara:strand:+ start:9962 stop:10228 length:267 start_codon:yes stop_codon:yes gene_type:complete
MEEAKSELQVHHSHVVVPIAFFERVMEVYYTVKGGGIVGQEEKTPLQSPASYRPSQDMNIPDVRTVRKYVPEGYTPRGAAARTDEDDA